MPDTEPSRRVLIFAPRGRTAEVLAGLVEALDAGAEVVATPDALARRLGASSEALAAVVVMFEDLASIEALRGLTDALQGQPSWSSLPVLVCSANLDVFETETGGDLLAIPGVRPVLRPVARAALATKLERAFEERARQHRVRDALRALEAARAASEARAVDLERATRGLAHDLRTPLNALLLSLDYLESEGSGGSSGILERARRTARQMDELTEELLAYARLTAEREADDQLGIVPLTPLVEQVVDRVQGLVERWTGRIEVDPLPLVWGNDLLLRQVVRNLVVNALRYCDADVPRVRIWAETEADRHVVRIADNGRGVPPEDRERIFDAYFRRAREPNGTGLGLALCRDAMKRQGGEIWLESSGPEGSVFALALPRPPTPETASDLE